MLKYGKASQNAIMALTYLAEGFDYGATRFNSRDIAQHRNLPQPIVAKLLVTLSQAGLVDGAPGPKGGYWLAKPPSEISLLDIVSHFEKIGERVACPFGVDRCNENSPCTFHRKLEELDQQLVGFLKENKLSMFTQELRTPRSTLAT
ncbi:RrF2 family transcriptional regulator [Pelagicoccus albus]|uniref:Rrf2 family transcriptional regulator n=1 Tax=Pelagicoccus albus TaxID=415222 RepID=A0A7X1E9J1_9BACT|nr:Rrf2 family transcriptional regulator [Pelagicoccus albus]MBC2607263.1 Rrf2 family transcriptional regulator [Pelagicoccus albus]